MSPERRRRSVEKVRRRLGQEKVSERRACRTLAQPRAMQRYRTRKVDADRQLIEQMRRLVESYPRYGSARVHQMLVGVGASGGGWRFAFSSDRSQHMDTTGDAISWVDYLLPLPHEVAVSGVVRVAPADVGVILSDGVSEMVSDAVAELHKVWREACGSALSGGAFVIHVGPLSKMGKPAGFLDAEAEIARLSKTPYPDQAYIIRSLGRRGLVVAGVGDRGIFYGLQTLRQLLTARLTHAEACIPLITVTDWPDFDERGLWNSGLSTPAHIDRLAGLKLNFEHMNHPVDTDPAAPRCPPLPIKTIRHARHRAFHLMPHCWHYDFWSESPNFAQHHPDLLGQGETARNPSSVASPAYHPLARCPCASNPALRQLLTAWICSAAEQGVREVSLWLTEYQPCRCSCPACVADGRHQLVRETEQSIRAIREARQAFPDLIGRLFLTFNIVNEEEERACRECLAMTPTDGSVRVEVVYGLQAPFEDYARAGHWVANYGVAEPLGGSWTSRGGTRLRLWPDPDSLRNRLRYLQSRSYSAIYNASSVVAGGREKGEVERHLCDFHLAMLAEWSWNAHGRSVEQFMRAWMMHIGRGESDAASQWLETMLPLERAVFPAIHALPAMIRTLDTGPALRLGAVPGVEAFPDSDRFEATVRAAMRCAELATDAGEDAMAAESRCLAAAVGVVRGVCRLSHATHSGVRDVAAGNAALQEVRDHTADLLRAAADQTAAWHTLSSSVATELETFTHDYWRRVLQPLVE